MTGQTAPDFSLLDQAGQLVSLSAFKGRWLVLYFYPEDGTPVCTDEACAFRDEHTTIGQFGNAEIVGISMDSPESHQQFADKNQLNFPILSDPDHQVIEAYDCWQSEGTPNRVFKGVKRNTFLINPEGTIAKVYEDISPEGHAQQIIQDLHELDSTN